MFCRICSKSLKENSFISVLDCGHVFCVSCIENKEACPVCSRRIYWDTIDYSSPVNFDWKGNEDNRRGWYRIIQGAIRQNDFDVFKFALDHAHFTRDDLSFFLLNSYVLSCIRRDHPDLLRLVLPKTHPCTRDEAQRWLEEALRQGDQEIISLIIPLIPRDALKK